MDANYPPGERAALRAAWFERAADALQRVLPKAPRCYVCPLCIRGFARAAIDHRVLTLEDVPPKALGGSPLVLTCQECNTRHGGTLDSQVAGMENLFNFHGGTMPDPIRMELQFGGVPITAKVAATGHGIIAISGRRGTPPVQVLKAAFEQQQDIRFTFPPFKYRPALLSVWRAGYLAAFAWLGYRYILRPDVQAARRRLLDENDETLRVFTVTTPDDYPSTRRILVIKKPTSQRSLVIQIGRHSAILPWINSRPDLYDLLARHGGRKAAMVSDMWRPWPTEPEFAMDFQ